jgi:hypothetical protein
MSNHSMIRRGTWLGGLFEEAVEELVDRAKQLAVRLRSLRPNNRARAVGGGSKACRDAEISIGCCEISQR